MFHVPTVGRLSANFLPTISIGVSTVPSSMFTAIIKCSLTVPVMRI